MAGELSLRAARACSAIETITTTSTSPSARAAAPAPETLVDALERAAAIGGPAQGLVFLDVREAERFFPWGEVRERARRAAGALAAAGVRPGDRVAIIAPTSPAFVDAFFGCQAAGAVPVPLYPPVRLGRLEEYHAATVAMAMAVRTAAIVATAPVRRLLGEVVAAARPPLGVIDAESLAAGAPGPSARAGPDDLAFVQFSSGTTVDPKPVALTHAQVLANVDAILGSLASVCPGEAIGVSWLPLYHDMGLIGCLLSAVRRPGRLVLIPPEVFLAKPAIWLRAISRHRAVISPAPNFAYSLCVERVRDEDVKGCDLSCWRMALNGAEPVSPATMRAFLVRFRPLGLREDALLPVYGLSEAALAVTFSPPGRPYVARRFDRAALARSRAIPAAAGDGVEIASVGRPLPGFEIEVRGPGGARRGEGEVGRIWVKGPSVMKGYLDRDDAPIRAGWLDTGDEGFFLEGELYIAGRAKDVIVLRGRNHMPQDIERALDGVKGVRTGCTAAVGDVGEEGERLVVFVEAREPRDGLAEDCRTAVIAATGLAPGEVVILAPGTIPRTSSGKIRRRETLRRWRAGTLQPPKPVTTWRVASAMVRSAIAYLRAR
jgi:acyl-CoA synthetase (AMP-forming)/AMP-acid ligase II